MMTDKFNLDEFYSAESIAEWKQIIGEELHYHFGYYKGGEDLKTAAEQTVRNFYPYIPSGSQILDAGCGWGGPAQLLVHDRQCNVTCITISQTQANYCRSLGLTVHQLNLEKDQIEGHYDVVFSLEVLSHIRDKIGLLKRLRHRADRLAISVTCTADKNHGERLTFGGSMILYTPAELKQMVKEAGWKIISMKDRRVQSMPTLLYWRARFNETYGDKTPPGQLNLLRQLTEEALKNPAVWAKSLPLIDIVAD